MVRRLIVSTSPPIPLIAHRIADANLVLEEQEESANQIAHQGLGAEAERDADDSGASQDRGNVDVKLAQHHQSGDAEDERGGDVGEDRAERAGPFGSFERIEPGAEADVVFESLHADGHQANGGVGHGDDEENAKAGVEGPAGEGLEVDTCSRVDACQLERRPNQNGEDQKEGDETDQPQRRAHQRAGHRHGVAQHPLEQSADGSAGEARRQPRQHDGRNDREQYAWPAWDVDEEPLWHAIRPSASTRRASGAH